MGEIILIIRYRNQPQASLFDSIIDESNITYKEEQTDSHDFFKRISPTMLNDIIENNSFSPHYHSYKIIDCRFDYEFEGGHIKNAINISNRDDLESKLLRNIQNNRNSPTLLIFHCEFSTHRGLKLASHLRNCDRILNHENYPKLYYPDVVILDGGYKAFFEKFPNHCFPHNYVRMDSQENLMDCENKMSVFRSDSKRSSTRTNSLRKLQSLSTETFSLYKSDAKSSHSIFLNDTSSKFDSIPSSSFDLEQPPRLSFSQYTDRFSHSRDCDDRDRSSPSTISRSSINSFNSLSSGKKVMIDDDNNSYFSFQTHSPNISEGNRLAFNDSNGIDTEDDLNFAEATITVSDLKGTIQETPLIRPIRRSLFPSILQEEDDDEKQN